MAGGGGQMTVSRSKRGGNSKRKTKKRVGFAVDLTPLVDITFLLLTFFMFTTTMAQPQVMEMKVPPESKPVDVDMNHLLTIYVRNDDKIVWAIGQDEVEEITVEQIRALSEENHLKSHQRNSLILAVKVEDNANYGIVVNILDELNLAETMIVRELADILNETGEPTERERRFAISATTDDDLEFMYPEGVPNSQEVVNNE